MAKKSLLLIILLSVNSMIFSAEVESKEKKEIVSVVELIDLYFDRNKLVDDFSKGLKRAGVRFDVNKQDMLGKITEKLSRQSSKDKLMKIYSDRFTSEEIIDLLKFYNSKAGKKNIEFGIGMAVDALKIMDEIMQEVIIEMTSKFEDLQLSKENEEQDELEVEC